MGRQPVGMDELVEHWTVLDDEQDLVTGKRGATKLGSALLLKLLHTARPVPPRAGRVRRRGGRFHRPTGQGARL